MLFLLLATLFTTLLAVGIVVLQCWLVFVLFATLTCPELWGGDHEGRFCIACRGVRWPWKY